MNRIKAALIVTVAIASACVSAYLWMAIGAAIGYAGQMDEEGRHV